MRKLNYFQNKPKLKHIDSFAYLERLGLRREEPTLSYLKKIHRHHLLKIPHENLSIHFEKKIQWDINELFKKIVLKNRGGINLELNYLLLHLLSQLGYNTYAASANLWREGEFGPSHEHMVVIVVIDEKPWLVDVGLKDTLHSPKELQEKKLQVDFNRYLAFFQDADENWLLKKSADTTNFETLYRFALEECQVIEFLQVHAYYQSDPSSPYRDGKFISQLFPEGRVTLTDSALISTLEGKREEVPILNEDEFLSKTEEYFGIKLGDLLEQ